MGTLRAGIAPASGAALFVCLTILLGYNSLTVQFTHCTMIWGPITLLFFNGSTIYIT